MPGKKYFEIAWLAAKDWKLSDFAWYIIRISYATLIPFMAGYFFCISKNYIYAIFILFPAIVEIKYHRDMLKDVKKIFVK